MKILHVVPSLNPKSGGPAELVRQLVPHLSQLGVTSTVACLDPPDSAWFTTFPFEIRAFGPAFGKYGFSFDFITQIGKLCDTHQAIIIHGIWQFHTFATWWVLRRSSKSYYIYPHGMLDPWFQKTYPLKHFKKLIYWLLFERQVLSDASSVIFTCDKEQELAVSSFPLLNVSSIVLPFGTSKPLGDQSIQRDLFFSKWPQLQSKQLLLFLGRIHPKKGLDILIEAFSLVSIEDRDLHLVLAGPDANGYQSILERRVSELGLNDRITWTGMLLGDLKWGALYAANLFCLPSHQENFGIAVAEALACGLPVSISDAINISDFVLNSSAGFVHPDTIEGTASALRNFLYSNDDQRIAMSDNARMLFKSTFDISIASRHLYDHISLR